MSNSVNNLYKKLSSLKDLKTAIKEVKKTFDENKNAEDVKITKSQEPVEVEQKPQDKQLKYLGRKKMIGGILSHLIGTGEDGDNTYQMDVNLEKYNQGMPCIIISHMSPKGEVLDHSSDYHKDMKSAIKAIVNHKMKKAWK